MAFPSSEGTIKTNLSRSWDNARDIAGTIKARSISFRGALASSVATSETILYYAGNMATMRDQLVAISNIPGIAAYANEQINNPAFDVATEFNTMVSALNGVSAWIIANFPKDGSGFLLAKTFHADNSGRTVERMFTSVQTAGLQTALDTLIAAIN